VYSICGVGRDQLAPRYRVQAVSNWVKVEPMPIWERDGCEACGTEVTSRLLESGVLSYDGKKGTYNVGPRLTAPRTALDRLAPQHLDQIIPRIELMLVKKREAYEADIAPRLLESALASYDRKKHTHPAGLRLAAPCATQHVLLALGWERPRLFAG
jgi:hypothetical protein